MPKAGKKNHILGDFFSEGTKKNAKTGKEFGIEGKKLSVFTLRSFAKMFRQRRQSQIIVKQNPDLL